MIDIANILFFFLAKHFLQSLKSLDYIIATVKTFYGLGCTVYSIFLGMRYLVPLGIKGLVKKGR